MNDDSKGFFRFLVLELFNGILSLLGSIPLIGAPFRWLQRNPAYALLGIFYYFCFRLSGTEAYLKQDYENCRQHQQQHRHTKSWHCDDGYRIQRLEWAPFLSHSYRWHGAGRADYSPAAEGRNGGLAE